MGQVLEKDTTTRAITEKSAVSVTVSDKHARNTFDLESGVKLPGPVGSVVLG